MTMEDIDAVAVTQGPGLIGALLIGINAAKALAFAYDSLLFLYTISLDTFMPII